MKEYKLMNFIVLLTVVFIVGLFVGERQRGRGPFFKSWYGKDLYYGEEVRVKKTDDGYNFYNPCEKMTIVGLQAVDNMNEAWVLLENCGFGERWTLDSFNQDSLEKK